MMGGLPLAFGAPAVLFGLVALPIIWWLLRMTPPRPRSEVFPPLKVLARVLKREETPSKSPWWLTALRLAMATLVILALADPVLHPRHVSISREGPLVLVIDNGWSSAPDWNLRMDAARRLIEEADKADLPVSLTFTADRNNDPTPMTAAKALDRLQAARPQPIVPDRIDAVGTLGTALGSTHPGTLAFLTDGIATPKGTEALKALFAMKPATIRLVEGDGRHAIAITHASNGADRFTVSATRLDTKDAGNAEVDAFDIRGRSIASGTLHFDQGSATGHGTISVPFELRNDFARLAIAGEQTAGATYLLDNSFRRRRVALLSGEPTDAAQQLLSPLYYIQRALQPYADIIQPKESDFAKAIPDILKQNPSVIVMADIGTLPEGLYKPLESWITGGGTLIRFAGPKLAGQTGEDPLIPVRLRAGERALGGTMSWSHPQKLADFPPDSPFAGMKHPDDVTVKRQVLAQPSPDLANRTWASLADGTPLVTARSDGRGRIVLFHVTAAPTWSNLPLSGTFVDMLRRTIQLSQTAGAAASSASRAQSLPPYRLLNADGVLVQPSGNARPIEVSGNALPRPSFDNPPGLYGTKDGFRALNLMKGSDTLQPLAFPTTSIPISRATLAPGKARSLKPWLFGAATIALLLDSLIVLAMAGAFHTTRFARRAGGTAALVLVSLCLAGLTFWQPSAAFAGDEKPGDSQILNKVDVTHLAYVVTGDSQVDYISKRGLTGLSEFLTYRTALEPGPPVGLDIAKDPLAFYPMIYWPISVSAPMPSNAAISRIDAYMKNGGTVLFDTRDQLDSLGNDGAVTPETARLRQILANLDIPPLEPVPQDHVLTKAFYILHSFPGRYSGGQMWVEASPESKKDAGRPVRAGDGVSPIIITSNDLAGAWAVDDNGDPLLPTVPPDPEQREYAFRVGVNLVMYMLTGNYKADQVHIPALLERLGQ